MSDFVIAHHLPDAIAQQLAAKLPAGVTLKRTPKDANWQVPEDAAAMIFLPPHAGVHFPDAAPEGWPFNLRWVQTVSTGIDDYPRWAFDVADATCARGVQANAIGEFAVASMLALEKRFPDIWIDAADRWYKEQGNPVGTIEGKTVGLIGFGTIGKAIAERAAPFGARVIATRRSSAPIEGPVEFLPLDEVLAQSDHLVLAAPLTPETRNIINAESLARMKQGAHFVNIARGAMVDQEALVAALDSGHLRFATLDVSEPEPLPEGHVLYTHPKVRLSPHLSWGKGSNPFDPISALIIENARRFMDGRELLNPINRETWY